MTVPSTHRGPWRRPWALVGTCALLACGLLCGAGCQAVERLRGPGFDGRIVDWDGRPRENAPGDGYTGFSTKARQIEDNLAVP